MLNTQNLPTFASNFIAMQEQLSWAIQSPAGSPA